MRYTTYQTFDLAAFYYHPENRLQIMSEDALPFATKTRSNGLFTVKGPIDGKGRYSHSYGIGFPYSIYYTSPVDSSQQEISLFVGPHDDGTVLNLIYEKKQAADYASFLQVVKDNLAAGEASSKADFIAKSTGADKSAAERAMRFKVQHWFAGGVLHFMAEAIVPDSLTPVFTTPGHTNDRYPIKKNLYGTTLPSGEVVCQVHRTMGYNTSERNSVVGTCTWYDGLPETPEVDTSGAFFSGVRAGFAVKESEL